MKVSMPLTTCPSIGPYMGVSYDKVIKVPKVGTFRIIIFAAYNAGGLIGPEFNGIAVFNDEDRDVVCDRLQQELSGYHGPSPAQVALFELLTSGVMSAKDFCAVINNSDQLRYPLVPEE
jgi:hypothetical protein